MDVVLRGLHTALGELALLFIIWALAEVAWRPSGRAVLRAKIASLSGTILIFAHWLVSGVYYVAYYGPEVKPAIKAGAWPWGHTIFMESKEHIFLFLPFLSILLFFLIWKNGDKLREERGLRYSIFAVGGVTVLVFLLMVVSGFLISSGYRVAVP